MLAKGVLKFRIANDLLNNCIGLKFFSFNFPAFYLF